MVTPSQAKNIGIKPGQASTISAVGAAQTGIGIDITELMNLMITMMIVVMMMKMMSGMISSAA